MRNNKMHPLAAPVSGSGAANNNHPDI